MSRRVGACAEPLPHWHNVRRRGSARPAASYSARASPILPRARRPSAVAARNRAQRPADAGAAQQRFGRWARPNRFQVRKIAKALRDAGAAIRARSTAPNPCWPGVCPYARELRQARTLASSMSTRLVPARVARQLLIRRGSAVAREFVTKWVDETTYGQLRRALMSSQSTTGDRAGLRSISSGAGAPSGNQRYVVVNTGRRPVLYDNGQIVDSMRGSSASRNTRRR